MRLLHIFSKQIAERLFLYRSSEYTISAYLDTLQSMVDAVRGLECCPLKFNIVTQQKLFWNYYIRWNAPGELYSSDSCWTDGKFANTNVARCNSLSKQSILINDQP